MTQKVAVYSRSQDDGSSGVELLPDANVTPAVAATTAPQGRG